jgi:iron-sulfur cluster insertion protein
MTDKKDDEMNVKSSNQVLKITDQAVAAAISLRQANTDWHGLDLRVYLSGKGCDGFDYGVTFDSREEKDVAIDCGSITAIVDPDSLQFVRGSTIEWVDDARGRGFLVENPNHKKFRGKFYKRKGWQEKLQDKLQG